MPWVGSTVRAWRCAVRSKRSLFVWFMLTIVLAACAAPSQSPTSVGAPPSAPPSPSIGPKRIVTAVVGQPLAWVERLRAGPRVGAWNLFELTTGGLSLIDADGN